MSKEKKINPNKFAGFINEHKMESATLTYTNNEESFEVTVKPRLDATEMAIMVNSVVREVFDPVDNSYNPEIYDLCLRKAVIEAYTNVIVPENLDKAYELIYGADLFEHITINEADEDAERFGLLYSDKSIIDMLQYNLAVKAIDDKINFKINEYYKKSKLDNLIDVVMGMIENYGSQFKDIDIKDTLSKLSSLADMKEETLAKAVVEHIKEPESAKIINFPQAVTEGE